MASSLCFAGMGIGLAVLVTKREELPHTQLALREFWMQRRARGWIRQVFQFEEQIRDR